MNFEQLLCRDLDYPEFLDWPNFNKDKFNNYYFNDPRNNRRLVLYRLHEFFDYDIENIYDKTTHEHTAWYYGSKLSRKDGPSYIEKSSNLRIQTDRMYNRSDIDHYKVEWRTKGIFNRKNGPAFYDYDVNNLTKQIHNLHLEWHVKPKYYTQGTLHRLNGPAIHATQTIKYYLNGKKYSEYDYWMYMLKNHPKKMPKILSKTNTKITFESDMKKIAPKCIYRKIKKVTWQYNCENMKAIKFWDIVDSIKRKSEKWLIVK